MMMKIIVLPKTASPRYRRMECASISRVLKSIFFTICFTFKSDLHGRFNMAPQRFGFPVKELLCKDRNNGKSGIFPDNKFDDKSSLSNLDKYVEVLFLIQMLVILV